MTLESVYVWQSWIFFSRCFFLDLLCTCSLKAGGGGALFLQKSTSPFPALTRGDSCEIIPQNKPRFQVAKNSNTPRVIERSCSVPARFLPFLLGSCSVPWGRSVWPGSGTAVAWLCATSAFCPTGTRPGRSPWTARTKLREMRSSQHGPCQKDAEDF